MTRLTDAQSTVLAAAATRPDGNVLPLPANLKGGAAQKIVTALLSRGLVAEVNAVPGAPVWRDTDGHRVTLVMTDAAFEALGVEPLSAPTGPHQGAEVVVPRPGSASGTKAPAAPTTTPVRKTREGTKQALLIAMLRREEGATIGQIVEATEWQPRTVRGAMAGVLKKRLGLTVTSEKVEAKGRVYRIES